ncbi:MAG: Hsp20/alpha crystallin family protein [Betaproteobacteria bacterium]|nr:MAG: Hsp20/alpha crystallin family protein [Betaproteobacteria bacterium]TMH93386.1 MAG: Hsp20/alpha crystallin family protein [Betaproteobacteria bacterium]
MTDKQVATRTQSAPAMIPNVDVVEDDAGITISADLPGVPKDKLLLRIEGETLQIEGELVSDAPEGMEAIYAEVRLPRYRRAFTLSRELDTEKINASMKDGVLNLRIPKAEHAQPRRIEVKAT